MCEIHPFRRGRRPWSPLAIAALASIPLLALARPAPAQAPVVPADYQRLAFRSIGPAFMGGRVTDIEGIPGDPRTFYFGTGTGGVFKTVDGGVSFTPIFDEVGVLSIGALAVAPSDPAVVYVGTGEGNPRNSASVGRGVWRSVDAGSTWRFVGLDGTEKISKILVHPSDPDVVYAAALGHEWGPNQERGIYRSLDGGATWEKILYVDENTGGADLAMDPANPRILYAAMYDFRRRPWHFRSGGPGSGLWRTADGGDTWESLTASAPDNGLPDGLLGRIGVAVAPSDPAVVYALMESEADGELWRSDDRGGTWRRVSDDPSVNSRPFYFTHLRVDPSNAERLYSLSGRLVVSSDGGRSWEELGDDIHPDHHAMWIDPQEPDRILDGNDGGIYATLDGGESWRYLNTVPLGQFYQIGVDMRDPYYVCGGLQDNGVWCGPSRSRETVGLVNDDWYTIHFGDGYYAQIDPTDWSTVFTNTHYGNIVRVDVRSGEKQSIQPYPVSLQGSAAGDHPYRFNWNSPVHMSPHDPNVVYFGSNVLFKTTDGGYSWDIISPDLTTNDPEKQKPSGGDITVDNTSAEYHTTIYTIAESPVQAGVIWVGSDDGLLHVTRDGGGSWTDVTGNVPGLPPESWVSRVEASRTGAGTAYVTFDRHRLDDMKPYVYKTTDFGRSWTDVSGNLPDPGGFSRVIREDPRNPDVLYIGTEHGLWISFTGGGRWQPLTGMGLPPVRTDDVVIHPRDNDLVVATHGRSVWILDDVTPFQEMAQAKASGGPWLFQPVPATRYRKHFTKPFLAQGVFKSGDPGSTALLSYYLPAVPEGPVTLTVEDGGTVLRTLRGTRDAGVNRIRWDLGYGGSEGSDRGFAASEPALRVLPGTYTVRLSVDGFEASRDLVVRLAPELDVSRADLEAQRTALVRLMRMRDQADQAMDVITDLDGQLGSLSETIPDDAAAAAEVTGKVQGIMGALDSIRVRIVSVPGGYRSPAMLQGRIRQLLESIGSFTGRPTDQQSEWIGRFDEQLGGLLDRLEAVLERDVADLNETIRDAGWGTIRAKAPPRRRTAANEEDAPLVDPRPGPGGRGSRWP